MSDPASRSLRGLISTAVRYGNLDLAEEYRQQLRIENIERAITRQLDGAPPLTVLQVRALRQLVESYGPQGTRAVREAESERVAV